MRFGLGRQGGAGGLLPRAAAAAVITVLLGGLGMWRQVRAEDVPEGPRAAAWKQVQQALDEGKPKSALAALAGVEAEATQAKAWAEVARAIATRVLAETGDRPLDDPERVIRLATAMEKAPPETRGVLEAIRANWTWGYYQENQWRYQQRTQGGAAGKDLARLGEWDLPTILAEIRARFAAAVGGPGSPERKAIQSLPVADWDALIRKGSMPDAYRPTVWDVVARDALEFAASGERGLMAPEDAFELDGESPALGTREEFLAWRPEADEAVTDKGSPLIEAAALYRGLLEFHLGDADPSALLAADLDRILWAGGAAVGEGLEDRKEQALRSFIERAGDHETAALASFHLASLIQGQGDSVAARELAAKAAAQWPETHGGAQCANLVAQLQARELSLSTERAWAAPFPAIRVTYRNLAKVHLRVCKADWLGRLKVGKPHSGWLDEEDRGAILALPAVREHAADLPATPDYHSRSEDLPVAGALDAATLEPGPYWVIASHRPDFGEQDNVVAVTMVWVTRLAIVTEQQRPVFARAFAVEGDPAAAVRWGRGPRGSAMLAGHVVDLATGEPVPAASVQLFMRQQRGDSQGFDEAGAVTTDAEGRFELEAEQGRELVVVAKATLAGRDQTVASGSANVWPTVMPDEVKTIVLVTDRGIHRPGQIVFYKGIVAGGDLAEGNYAALAGVAVEVVLRDANGREVAKASQTTNANGSFHGNFPIPAGCLPGQWSIQAQAAGTQGGTGVRVEEYKRPKFQVKLAAPEKSVPLGGEAMLTGKATTYTGLPVADATVRWRVERSVRFPIWCRWFFPGLPFDAGAQRIARGTARTDAAGSFTVAFPARPDRSAPKESLPVFTYRVVADVTDPGGETRSDERSLNVGYTDVEASVSVPAWQARTNGEPAAVSITVSTTTLDGEVRAAEGRLTVQRLVQPVEVARGDLQGGRPLPMPMLRRGATGRVPPKPPEPDPADPETWAAGETVVEEPVVTDKATGKKIATTNLPAGIYRATFQIPAAGDVPAVKATTLVEVVDPAAKNYGVKRPFVMRAERTTVEPGSEFQALVGTGYDAGRAVVEISQAGKVLKRFWTEPGRTQWPVAWPVTAANRGGFTVRAWMVRDGRLHVASQTVDVPWTDKQLAVAWERFTRRTEPGAKEVWRAKISSVADPVVGPARPQAAEFLALAYDQSLKALAPHAWPGGGLLGLFRRESGWLDLAFTNAGEMFHHVRGNFAQDYRDVPEMTFRMLRDPFGTPQGGWGFGRRRGMLVMAAAAAPDAAMMAEAMPREAAAPPAAGMAKAANRAEKTAGDAGAPPASPAAGQAAPPPPRKNLVETAFFLPVLSSNVDGIVTIEFTLPDTLTTWQFKGLAHDAALRSGVLVDTCVSTKSLMVEPLVPRFLREGDLVKIPVKVSNTSTGRLAGTVRFALADARTDADKSGLIEGPNEQSFDLASGESRPVVFTVKVADGTDVLKYLATGSADASGTKAADGEEAFVPVLPRRVPVTETIPITIRGPGTRKVSLERLAASAGTDIESQSLVVQAASNPAWYGVLALPVIMEEADESTETLFTRLYANSLARHLATSDPRIARIFEQWKGTAALTSPLEKNSDLVQTLLAETPWVRDAVDETEARARIALLFDTNRATNEARAALERLESLRNGDGGWPWFPGGRSCDSVTLGIIAGFGRLRAAGVDIDVQPALAAIPWLDGRLVEERKWARERWKDKPDDIVLTPTGASALYARSFFTQDAPPAGDAAEAIRWGFDVARTSWMKIDPRLSQGQLAIALARSGDKPTALSIIDSLKQRAVDADVKPGQEKESWQGMWWRDAHPGWWSWAHAPIATQAIMIEAFDEVAGDEDSVEALKAWLLSQKRTSRWPGSRATADAVGALLGRGGDLLGSEELVTVTVGDERIVPERVEAGTGFFETRFVRREITPAMAAVTLEKPDQGLAFGGVHWQYLDDIANVPAAGREELAIEKRLFVKRFTKAGPELVPAGDGVAVKVGDELVVRLVVTSDRDYEFLELADHRPSLTEPVDVLSGWRWGDGAGWYLAIRDASTQLFFERLPRGTHVFEYSLRAAHRGTASSGFASIRSRYAPEFSARSQSISLEVK
ncbi:MAG: alpha-2-macroglobulin family protein [Planctomycetota bacterium]